MRHVLHLICATSMALICAVCTLAQTDQRHDHRHRSGFLERCNSRCKRYRNEQPNDLKV